MKADYLFENGTLKVRKAGQSLQPTRLRPLDLYGFGFEFTLDGEVVGYELNGIEDYHHYRDGAVKLPFEEPAVRFEIEGAPGQTFSFSELVKWVVERTIAERSARA